MRQEKCERRGRLGDVGEEVGAGAGMGSEGEDSGCLIRLESQRRRREAWRPARKESEALAWQEASQTEQA